MNGFRFNPPPNWPLAQGWIPPVGWEPDPSWPPPPSGWQMWLPDAPEGAPPTAAVPQQYAPPPGVPAGRKRGWFGRRRRDEASELEELRQWIAQTHGADAAQVAGLMQRTRQEAAALRTQAQTEAQAVVDQARQAAKDIKADAKQAAKDTERIRKEAEQYRGEIYQAETRLSELRAQIVTTDETVLL
ncbi:ATP synthase F0 subunit B [Streptomyces sp. NPDC047315]|uniref:ATP synthase F0 subunit B n=1 Tax=Streptomyces sp. NPDC047315 TaxID=3155142 RepID=UPI0033F65259